MKIVASQNIKFVFHNTDCHGRYFLFLKVSVLQVIQPLGSSLTLLSVTNLLKLICIQFNLQARLRYSSFGFGIFFATGQNVFRQQLTALRLQVVFLGPLEQISSPKASNPIPNSKKSFVWTTEYDSETIIYDYFRTHAL